MVANILVFFSNLYNSKFPAFSIAVLISSNGFPIREIPFSIKRATGELVCAHNILAASILPDIIFILILFMKLESILDALLIAINRSKYKNKAKNNNTNNTNIMICPPIPPLVNKLQIDKVCSVGCASVAT